jgi:hypothetical protein
MVIDTNRFHVVSSAALSKPTVLALPSAIITGGKDLNSASIQKYFATLGGVDEDAL